MFFRSFAEMDAPISNTEAHPYGRRRAGLFAGNKEKFLIVFCASAFIESQMYELI